jgi:hypothetical protein
LLHPPTSKMKSVHETPYRKGNPWTKRNRFEIADMLDKFGHIHSDLVPCHNFTPEEFSYDS